MAESDINFLNMEPAGMDFVSAIKKVMEGQRVHRKDWDEKTPKTYVSIKSDVLSIKNEDGTFHGWMISRDDMEAQDWEIWRNPLA